MGFHSIAIRIAAELSAVEVLEQVSGRRTVLVIQRFEVFFPLCCSMADLDSYGFDSF